MYGHLDVIIRKGYREGIIGNFGLETPEGHIFQIKPKLACRRSVAGLVKKMGLSQPPISHQPIPQMNSTNQCAADALKIKAPVGVKLVACRIGNVRIDRKSVV